MARIDRKIKRNIDRVMRARDAREKALRADAFQSGVELGRGIGLEQGKSYMRDKILSSTKGYAR